MLQFNPTLYLYVKYLILFQYFATCDQIQFTSFSNKSISAIPLPIDLKLIDLSYQKFCWFILSSKVFVHRFLFNFTQVLFINHHFSFVNFMFIEFNLIFPTLYSHYASISNVFNQYFHLHSPYILKIHFLSSYPLIYFKLTLQTLTFYHLLFSKLLSFGYQSYSLIVYEYLLFTSVFLLFLHKQYHALKI